MLHKYSESIKQMYLKKLSNEIPEIFTCKVAYILSILFGIMSLIAASNNWLTISFQFWNFNRIMSLIGNLRGTSLLESFSDQMIYMGLPMTLQLNFQYCELIVAFLCINNYMNVNSKRYQNTLLIGHEELYLIITSLFLFPEFKETIALNFLALLILSIIVGVIRTLKCNIK